LNQGLAAPLWQLSLAQSYAGLHDEAVASGERLVSVAQRAPAFLGTLGAIYVRAGRLPEARAIEAELDRRSASEYITPYVTGILKGWLGDLDGAFRLLEQAYEERNTLLWVLAREAGSDPLRADPRFDDVVRRIGLR